VKKYELSYKQSRRERYDSKMNAEVEDFIEAFPGVRLVGSSGGAMMTADADAMTADNSYTVESTQGVVRTLVAAIERMIERPVTIDMQ